MTSPKDQVIEKLDEAARSGRRYQFWWRDDDAIAPSTALDRLIAIANTHAAPLCLAVIPKKATNELAARVAAEPLVAALQHGWQHRNHADREAGERASEFGDGRPLEASLTDLAAGRARMAALFGDNFLPVLVPPWNRAAEPVIAARRDLGLSGYSGFGTLAPHAGRLDAHVDPIKWKPTPHFVGADRAWTKCLDELNRRSEARAAPIGLLTHHLGHEDDLWTFLDECVSTITDHDGAAWLEIDEARRMWAG